MVKVDVQSVMRDLGSTKHKHYLRYSLRRHPGLVVENPPEVISVGEHVGLPG